MRRAEKSKTAPSPSPNQKPPLPAECLAGQGQGVQLAACPGRSDVYRHAAVLAEDRAAVDPAAGIGSWGGQRPSMAPYVTGTGADPAGPWPVDGGGVPAYDAAQSGGRGRRARRLLMCAVAAAPERPASEYGRLCHGDGGPEGGRPVPEGANVDYAPRGFDSGSCARKGVGIRVPLSHTLILEPGRLCRGDGTQGHGDRGPRAPVLAVLEKG
jgi:hypothetical protein